MHVAPDALGRQVPHRGVARAEEEVRQVVCDDPVDLLRHMAVEASEPRFDVGDRHGDLRRRQGAGQGGVRIAVDHEPVRALEEQHVLDAAEHGRGLIPVRAGPDAQVDVGRRDLEPVEEDAGHLVVVVLPGVHQDFLVALAELAAQGGRLDELRPRAHDGDELHGRPSRAATNFTTSLTTRCCCSGASPGNIGSDRTSEAARSETGKSPGRKPSASYALTRWSGIG